MVVVVVVLDFGLFEGERVDITKGMLNRMVRMRKRRILVFLCGFILRRSLLCQVVFLDPVGTKGDRVKLVLEVLRRPRTCESSERIIWLFQYCNVACMMSSITFIDNP